MTKLKIWKNLDIWKDYLCELCELFFLYLDRQSRFTGCKSIALFPTRVSLCFLLEEFCSYD